MRGNFGCDKYLLELYLDVGALSCKNHKSPSPKGYLEAYYEERAEEKSLRSEKRLEYGKSDKSAVAHKHCKLGDLSLVKIFDFFAGEKSEYRHKAVQAKTYKKHSEADFCRFGRVIHSNKRGKDKHGLSYADYKL